MSSIFADRIRTAKELNRRSGAILREARQRPITIVTEGRAPVVMEPRDQAAAGAAAREWIVRIVPLIAYLQRGGPQPPSGYGWVADLAPRSRRELARELPDQLERAARSGDFASLDQYLYGWQATSEVDADPVLRRRLRVAARAAARLR